MESSHWYFENRLFRCEPTATWDVSFGVPGRGFGTIECHSEVDANRLSTLLNQINALPTDVSYSGSLRARTR